MRRSLRDRLFASLQALGGRPKRREKTGWLSSWLRPGLEELESRRVMSAQNLHPDGTAFQVADSQFNTFVAADGNGNSIVTWQAPPSGSSSMAIYAEQYNNQGHAIGSPILVAGPPGVGSLQSVGVVADVTGDFVVIWKATDARGGSSLQRSVTIRRGSDRGARCRCRVTSTTSTRSTRREICSWFTKAMRPSTASATTPRTIRSTWHSRSIRPCRPGRFNWLRMPKAIFWSVVPAEFVGLRDQPLRPRVQRQGRGSKQRIPGRQQQRRDFRGDPLRTGHDRLRIRRLHHSVAKPDI